MGRVVLFLLLLLNASLCYTQNSLQWFRYPSISPDGKFIAFTWQGHIYIAASSGGKAVRLCNNAAIQTMPVWSRNSREVAFAGNDHGNFDVYIKDTKLKDSARRLTAHSTDEYPYDFSADNKKVIFGAARIDAADNRQFPSEALPELYAVPAVGGRITQLLTTPAEDARESNDGRWIIYHDRKGRENPWRKHQLSSVARDVWLYDTRNNKHTLISSFAGEDRNPVFTEDQNYIYYLSERSGSFNVFYGSLHDTASPRQVTFYKTNPVRFLSVSRNGTLCYGYDGQVYTKKKNRQPAKVAISIALETEPGGQLTVQTGEVQEMTVSPSGKEVAWTFRGEVFVQRTVGNTVKQITHTAEAEAMLSFSPNGKELLYASERGGRWQIVKASAAGELLSSGSSIREMPLIENSHENYQPQFSPDGREVAYIEDRVNLKIYNIATGSARGILTKNELYSRHDNDQYFKWSPDGKWLLVQYTEPGAGNNEVGVVSTSGQGRLINITQSGYSDTRPQWMMNGKMITWLTDRQGLHSYAYSSTSQGDVFGALVLNNDWENLRRRKRRISVYPSLLGDALLTDDGKQLYYLSKLEKNYDLWVTDVADRTTKMLLPLNVNEAEMTWDSAREHIFILANGRILQYSLARNKIQQLAARTDVAVDLAKERAAMFEHVWRRTRETFYSRDMHGTNWDAMKEIYHKYLDGINNNYDLAEMFNELLGELNVSHTGATYSDPGKNKDVTASLGVIYDQQYTGAGARILEVLHAGPLDSASYHINRGAVIEAIDGVAIGVDKNIEEFLNQKAGKDVTLTISGSVTIIVKPVTPEIEADLMYDRWVDRNEKETDSLSKGNIGYVHLYRMNDAAYRSMYENVMGRFGKCKALIIDTRFNRGGDLATELAMFLTGVGIRQNATDNFLLSTEPSFRWTKPSILLANEANYSDGHCFAYDYKFLHLGKMVGMPVPGSCTWMTGETLQDNSMHYSVPSLGVKTLDGRFMENQQTKPDIQVMNDYESVSHGEDRQLEAAIKDMEQGLRDKNE